MVNRREIPREPVVTCRHGEYKQPDMLIGAPGAR